MLETLPMLAAEAGNFGPFLPLAFAGLGAGVGVGIVGGKAAEAVGRNPSAFGSILTMAIIGIAVLLWWFVWSAVRIIKGIIALTEKRPIANPESWLFG